MPTPQCNVTGWEALRPLRLGEALVTVLRGGSGLDDQKGRSNMIDHLRGREKALEAFGWTGRRAEWIALACLHGGVFTRAQWTSFLGCHHEHVRRAVHAVVAQGAAIEENPPDIAGIGRVCRIHRRGIYRALGAEDIRHRRITSKEVLMPTFAAGKGACKALQGMN